MAHVIERSPNARAKCRGCGEKIAANDWRLGERLPNPYDDKGGEMTHWFHVACAAYRRPEAFLEGLSSSADAFDHRADLEREAALGVSHRRLPRISTAERAATGRATCRHCKTPIDKDAWRVALLYYEDGRFSPSGFVHVSCVPAYVETTDVMARIKHFSPALTAADLAEIQSALASV